MAPTVPSPHGFGRTEGGGPQHIHVRFLAVDIRGFVPRFDGTVCARFFTHGANFGRGERKTDGMDGHEFVLSMHPLSMYMAPIGQTINIYIAIEIHSRIFYAYERKI